MKYKNILEKIASLTAEVEENRGKRGNPERRAELAVLSSELMRKDKIRAEIRAKSYFTTRGGRSELQASSVRAIIEIAARINIKRGFFAEIEIPFQIERVREYKNHPSLKRFKPLFMALETEIHLPEKRAEFDAKGRGYAVNRDLYGFTADGKCAIWQVRTWNKKYTHGFANTSREYWVATEHEAHLLPQEAAAVVRKAAAAENAEFDAPLVAVRDFLPAGVQQHIEKRTVKFAAKVKK